LRRGPSLDTLLDLDGQVLVLDPHSRDWVRFVGNPHTAQRGKAAWVELLADAAGPNGERLVGFDNAHSVRTSAGPGGKSQGPQDHRHRLKTVRPYEYSDAATLLEDFWREVEAVLAERGIEL
jgi:hypothetical protein